MDTPPEIVHASALVAVSNITRNVQSANQLRFRSNANAFVDVVASLFEDCFARVTKNRPVESGSQNTDIDVISV